MTNKLVLIIHLRFVQRIGEVVSHVIFEADLGRTEGGIQVLRSPSPVGISLSELVGLQRRKMPIRCHLQTGWALRMHQGPRETIAKLMLAQKVTMCRVRANERNQRLAPHSIGSGANAPLI